MKLKQICAQATPCDTVYLYISSHGNPDGSVDRMQGPHNDGGVVQQDKIKFYPYRDLNLEQCKACHIIIQFDTCYSGKVLNDMKNQIEWHPNAYHGKKVILVSSAGVDEYGFGREKPLEPGSWFGFHLLEEYRGIIHAALGPLFVLTVDEVSAAFDLALPRVVQDTAQYFSNTDDQNNPCASQHPTKWVRPLEPGERCNANGVTTR